MTDCASSGKVLAAAAAPRIEETRAVCPEDLRALLYGYFAVEKSPPEPPAVPGAVPTAEWGPRAGAAAPLVKAEVAVLILGQAASLPLEDKAILLAIAEHESGFNPAAKNPASSAHGVFQIIDSTWRGLGFSARERVDVLTQVKGGITLYGQYLASLKQRGLSGLHSGERLVEMYRLHHDGTGPFDRGGRAIARNHVLKRFQVFQGLLSQIGKTFVQPSF